MKPGRLFEGDVLRLGERPEATAVLRRRTLWQYTAPDVARTHSHAQPHFPY